MRPQAIRSVVLLGSVSLAAASDIVSLILPYVDPQDIVGEVIGSDGPMTTYVLNCPDSTDPNDCGLPSDGFTITAGPTAFAFDYTYDDYYLSESCEVRDTTWYSCHMENSQSDFSTTTAVEGSLEVSYIAVTVTATATDADAESTSTAVTTTTTTTTSESSSESSSTTVSESASVATQPSESASATTSAEETPTDNAAIAQVTGSATQWLVSGAGMALALALA